LTPEIRIIPLGGIPEVRAGDDLSALLLAAAAGDRRSLLPGDILVVTQKIVSKAEGRVVALTAVTPSSQASEMAQTVGKDARVVELILRESKRVVRLAPGVLITETKHGFVCANSGVDASNIDLGSVCLLPEDPDGSAQMLRNRIQDALGIEVPVVISDTFGRAWREGQTNVAIGIAGMSPFIDYVGRRDTFGRELQVSTLAVADELASAAELAMGKLDRVPAVIVRGFPFTPGSGSAREMVRPAERDLFR